MSYFKDNQKKVPKPYFPKQSYQLPAVAVHYTPYSNLFSKALSDLTNIIPSTFSNPSQSSTKKLIDISETIKRGLKHLNLTPTQQETGIAIVGNLITILNKKPLAASEAFIELQNLLNFSLNITKLSKMNHPVFKNIIEQTKELQITLLQITPIGMNGQFQDQQALLDQLGLIEQPEPLVQSDILEQSELLEQQESLGQSDILEQTELLEQQESLGQSDILEQPELLLQTDILEQSEPEPLIQIDILDQLILLVQTDILEQSEPLGQSDILEQSELLDQPEPLGQSDTLEQSELLNQLDPLVQSYILEQLKLLGQSDILEQSELLEHQSFSSNQNF
ncbi:collagen-like repeat preface domain-containing protein [Bacillus rhizoplanae]|uniref:collagen-like repeat preface domain-containing protein n=1 Tax=Bacillus rhizoplanae TaxID=2880966 RepID=UPI003D190FC4